MAKPNEKNNLLTKSFLIIYPPGRNDLIKSVSTIFAKHNANSRFNTLAYQDFNKWDIEKINNLECTDLVLIRPAAGGNYVFGSEGIYEAQLLDLVTFFNKNNKYIVFTAENSVNCPNAEAIWKSQRKINENFYRENIIIKDNQITCFSLLSSCFCFFEKACEFYDVTQDVGKSPIDLTN